MKNKIVISELSIFSIYNIESRKNAIDQIKQYLQKEIETNKIYLVSSIELFAILDEYIITDLLLFIKDKFESVSVIANGCISFNAVTLDFSESTDNKALVVFLEGPLQTLQKILDSLKIGRNELPDNTLIAHEGYAICKLTKNPSTLHTNFFCVTSSKIITRGQNNSPIELLKKLEHQLRILCYHETKIVSFQNNTHWCKSLLSGYSLLKKSSNIPVLHNWLQSYETDNNHFHSLKSLYEISKYNSPPNSSLIILSLGANGRIGILKIENTPKNFISEKRLEKCRNRISLSNVKYLLSEYSPSEITEDNIKEKLYCMKRVHAYKDNFYFEWIFD